MENNKRSTIVERMLKVNTEHSSNNSPPCSIMESLVSLQSTEVFMTIVWRLSGSGDNEGKLFCFIVSGRCGGNHHNTINRGWDGIWRTGAIITDINNIATEC